MDPTEYAAALEALFGEGAHELVAKFAPSGSDLSSVAQKKDRRKRQITAGLSAVGAGAGVAGLAYAARDVRAAVNEGRKIPFRSKALMGAEVAGLGGELMATKILHSDTKQKKIVKRYKTPLTEVTGDTEQQGLNLGARGQLVRIALKKGPSAVEHGKATATKAKGVAADIQTRRMTTDMTTNRGICKRLDFDFSLDAEISKIDTDKRQVFGWASIVERDGEPVVDLQGDYISPEEIEKAAYSYVQKSRKGGDMHQRDGEGPRHVSDMIESFLVTPEKIEKLGLPADSLPTGWWVGFQVHDDDTWNLVKSGKRKMFSIHGKGRREAL